MVAKSSWRIIKTHLLMRGQVMLTKSALLQPLCYRSIGTSCASRTAQECAPPEHNIRVDCAWTIMTRMVQG